MRIVSLLPSATEILCEVGLQDALVGVTHECDFPASIAGLPILTRSAIPAVASSGEIDACVREQLATEQSLYHLDHDLLRRLAPDLIVTQTLCSVCAVAEKDVQRALCDMPSKARVVNLEPQTLMEVLESLETVADAAGVPEAGRAARRRLQDRIDDVQSAVGSRQPRPGVIVLEWIDPPFTAGHWVPEIVELAGGVELIGKAGQRSVTMDWADLIHANPDKLLISCCGFSVPRTLEELPLVWNRLDAAGLRCVRNEDIYVLDGSAYLSRPGPRLVTALEIIASILHPAVIPMPGGPEILPPVRVQRDLLQKLVEKHRFHLLHGLGESGIGM